MQGFYIVKLNTCMDKDIMALWVNMALKLYIQDKPCCVCPLLLLKSYWCHMIELVTSQKTALAADFLNAPSGCTLLCQLAHIGICKPFKFQLKKENTSFFLLIPGETSDIKEFKPWRACWYDHQSSLWHP